MIIDLPSYDDFQSEGIGYAMMAYSNVFNLIRVLEEFPPTDEGGTEEEFWNGARGRLRNSANLLHQGIDFLLKANICKVSPFLLIDTSPDKIPKPNKSGNIAFSDIYTHDSSKLPKIYNTVCSTPLIDDFMNLYERSRTRRNKIMHTVDKTLVVEAKTVIKESIELIKYLVNDKWVDLRREFLEESPESRLHYSSEVINAELVSEAGVLREILTDAEFIKTYGVTKKRRFYLCPDCYDPDFIQDQIGTCVLEPNTPQSTNAYCVICSKNFAISRERCSSAECKSNVIMLDNGRCGVCER